ncbi:SDR family NAD(P)-dependent oxidoreductase [Methylobacterium oxalidis]|uniref:Oxidoreductase n=1 Tax=Methylobacterium oxalidis TaxID=944322 RepID=A0A512JAU6_9HYPH|nr:SDR family NAD(P)-dependent oxidoreductase [Methylobacterium oxalidis]GEP07063.1 oxidoreductase [Methylobacterium oxalidis]GJE33903.1 3-phenylpropionate-dihydrodiol/cinnamic acid-dihydrodiol dehydrogenase [Methylobacterium oxalidis]GLS66431.1 oxidoreductase [Methylobacterium oxalidis]
MATRDGKGLAVVTGGSSGIGLELAKLFAADGYDLLIAARGERVEAVARRMREAGTAVEARRTDLSTQEGVATLHAAIRASERPLEAIAINAGVGLGGAFLENRWEDELDLMQLNVVGTVHLAKLVVPDMVARGRGRILFTASISGTTPVPFEAVYGASKSFVLSFAEALRNELRDTGVTVTALLPGQTETDFFHHAGMDDTCIGAGPKSDPADVAKAGYEAMMEGREKVVAGGLATRFEAAVLNRVLPESMKAERHRKMSEPGGAESSRNA